MDELLSFELANAEFTPWIVTTQPQGRLEKYVQNEIYGENIWETLGNLSDTVLDVIKNRGSSKLLTYQADVFEEPVWITKQQFHAYETTDSRDNFNYLSVYFNVKDDNHPPLHFMAIHTISSIFKNQINPWMGCVINLFAILGICILLIKICQEILEKDELSVKVCLLYGCSLGAIATLLLIRMYAMLTFWCIAALYFHLKKMKREEWNRKNKGLIFVILCGFWTQYYFVIFMIFLAGVTIYYLLKEKKHRELFCYIRSMIISALIGLVVYPFSVNHVLYSGRGVESVQNLAGGFDGIWQRLHSFGRIIQEEVLGGRIGTGILTVFLLMAAGFLFQRKKASDCSANKKALFMLGIPCLGYFLVVTKIAPYYEDRYMMPIFPILSLLLMYFVQWIWESCHLSGKFRTIASYGIILVFLLPGILTKAPTYQFKGYQEQIQISEQYAQIPCVCVYDGVGYYQNLIEFINYEKTLMVKEEELFSRKKDTVLSQQDAVVLLCKSAIDKEQVMEYLQENYGYHDCHKLLEKGVHGDMLYLLSK